MSRAGRRWPPWLQQPGDHQLLLNPLNRLSNNQVYRGMLYGAGLLALGFIVGFIVKKPKRRSGLM